MEYKNDWGTPRKKIQRGYVEIINSGQRNYIKTFLSITMKIFAT